MTIDVHASLMDSKPDKFLRITSAGASPTTVSLSITQTDDDGVESYIEILLDRDSALVTVTAIQAYFNENSQLTQH